MRRPTTNSGLKNGEIHSRDRSQFMIQSNLSIPLKAECSPVTSMKLLLTLSIYADWSNRVYFVEKLETGFVAWTSTVKGYAPAQDDGGLQWESESRPALQAMSEVMAEVDFFLKLAQLWSQESSRNGGTTEIRGDNVTFLKTLGPFFRFGMIRLLTTPRQPRCLGRRSSTQFSLSSNH